MTSQSLYRKWRSQSFDDIVGQPHVVRTLRNAIRHDRVAHAYLFTGPRGTGKTSTARILAKAVNCLDPQDGAPCTTCAMCVSIGSGRSPDVIEIDGASNNSIEDIRVLRERVAFAPAEARNKVYIIDEVHRLSGSAFDGLLKTLEEPPPHVVFVFASTEPHKVPATILSRCQRFDFRKIDRDDTITRLLEVAAAEALVVEAEAALLIAQQSGGSLRDALGILDQVRAFAGDSITAEQVRETVGMSRPALLLSIANHMLDANAGAALSAVHDAIDEGADPRLLLRQLIEYWRALLLEVSGAGNEIEVDPRLQQEMPGQAARIKPRQAVEVLRALTEEVIEPKLSVSPELPLELAVVQAILVLTGTPAPEGMAGTRETMRPEPTLPPSAKPQAEDAPGPPERASKEGSAFSSLDGQTINSVPVASSMEDASGDLLPDRNQRAIEGTIYLQDADDSLKTATLREDLEPLALERETTGDSGPASASPWIEAWPAVVEAAWKKSPTLRSSLRAAAIGGWTEEEVTLEFTDRFNYDNVGRQRNLMLVQTIIADVTGRARRVRCAMGVARSGSPQSAGDDTDDFIRDAEHMLRGVHSRQMKASQRIAQPD